MYHLSMLMITFFVIVYDIILNINLKNKYDIVGV